MYKHTDVRGKITFTDDKNLGKHLKSGESFVSNVDMSTVNEISQHIVEALFHVDNRDIDAEGNNLASTIVFDVLRQYTDAFKVANLQYYVNTFLC
jgi:hypothetical protein